MTTGSDDDIFEQLTTSDDMEQLARTAVGKAFIQGQISYVYYGIRVDVLTDILTMNQADKLAAFIRIGKNVVSMAAEGCLMCGYDPLTEEFLGE